jgi:hypothetical protein
MKKYTREQLHLALGVITGSFDITFWESRKILFGVDTPSAGNGQSQMDAKKLAEQIIEECIVEGL